MALGGHIVANPAMKYLYEDEKINYQCTPQNDCIIMHNNSATDNFVAKFDSTVPGSCQTCNESRSIIHFLLVNNYFSNLLEERIKYWKVYVFKYKSRCRELENLESFL